MVAALCLVPILSKQTCTLLQQGKNEKNKQKSLSEDARKGASSAKNNYIYENF